MDQVLSSVTRAVRVKKNSKSYEDIDGDEMEMQPGDETLNDSAGSGSEFTERVLDPGSQIEMTAAVAGVVPDDTFTVTQAVDAIGFGKFQVKLSLVTGLCWMADSMEMMILSILSPALHCAWHISSFQQAFLTTVVFFGMMVSSAFWGNVSDKYGRKQALSLAAVLLFYYGLLSSFAPTYTWIMILRALVGVTIGCFPQSVTLYAEFLPIKQRAKCVVLLDCFWALGACFEVLLALFVMPALGWPWLLALSTIPVAIFIAICPWLPESARFLAASGHSDKAIGTLKQVAADNGKPMLLGRLIVDDVQQMERGRIRDLLIPDLQRTTLLLWFIWMTCAFCYYGTVLMTAELFEKPGGTCEFSGKESIKTCAASCKPLTTTDYIDLLWTTLAEFPGILVTIMVIEKIGRKKTMALELILYTVAIFFLFKCTENRVYLTVMLFLARGIIAGVFQAAYVYTPEVYPTVLRSVGVGTCSGMARFGAMITPYVAQVMLKSSLYLAVAVYGVAAVLAAAASLLLPIETKGRAMH